MECSKAIQAALEIQHASLAIDQAKLLDDITLTLMPGEILAVVGPNGAGKSTLLHAIAGDRELSGGDIQVCGWSKDSKAFSLTQRARSLAVLPKRHKTSETTDIMLQIIACGRGVAALPRWLAEEYSAKLPLAVVGLGKHGIAKQIYLGMRQSDSDIHYLTAFIDLARSYQPAMPAFRR